MITDRNYYIQVLKLKLHERSERNPRYSLRSFAKALGINPGGLSNILNGKIPLSYKMALKLVSILSLHPDEKRKFLNSVVSGQRARDLKRVPREIKEHSLRRGSVRSLDIDLYTTISSWYHTAILELTHRDDFSDDPKWIAKKLSISQIEAKLAIERLFNLELLKKDGDKVTKVDDYLDTKDKHLTNSALKKKQKEIRQKAIDAIDNQSIDKRSMTTYTMCIDPKLIPLAKEKISKFQKEIGDLLTKGERKEVYVMEIGLFSLEQ